MPSRPPPSSTPASSSPHPEARADSRLAKPEQTSVSRHEPVAQLHDSRVQTKAFHVAGLKPDHAVTGDTDVEDAAVTEDPFAQAVQLPLVDLRPQVAADQGTDFLHETLSSPVKWVLSTLPRQSTKHWSRPRR